jgi:thioesterase domain-containing protein/acyl carrier protein
VGEVVGPEVAILAPDGRVLGPRETGEIAVRGPMVIHGYANNPEANARSFVDGWFRSGDLGHLDEAKHLYITGRLKEMINRGAEKVLPYEVEQVLRRHPMVQEVAVFGYPHPRLGEDIAAAVVPRPGTAPQPEELRAYAAESLTQVKVPRRILVLAEIPKGGTGKVQRTRLAEQLGVRAEAGTELDEGLGAEPGSAAAGDPVEQLVARVWRELLKVPRIEPDDEFFALGGDSLLVLSMTAQIEQELGCALDPAHLGRSFVFTAFVQAVREASGAQAPAARVPGVHVLRAEGRRPALFFLHGVYSFQPLVELLGGDRPVYAMEPPDEETLCQTGAFTDVVDTCVGRIRQVQEHGPYLLMGHSVGGLVAFECARRLLAAGEAVPGVILLDPETHGYRPMRWVPGALMNAQYLAHRLKLQVYAVAKLPPWRWPAYLRGRLQAVATRPPYKQAQRRILNDFELLPLAVPTLLVRCLGEDPGRYRKIGRRWRALVGRRLIRMEEMGGDHETMILSPHLETLAGHMCRFLEQVDPA